MPKRVGAYGDIGVFHVYGAVIVPSSVYDVELVDESCSESLDNPDCYSEVLTIQTGNSADGPTHRTSPSNPGNPLPPALHNRRSALRW